MLFNFQQIRQTSIPANFQELIPIIYKTLVLKET